MLSVIGPDRRYDFRYYPFNTVAWMQSEAWDGRYGIVVCVDIADLNEQQSFLNGAAAVAMLIGPDAPLVMQAERGTHMMNTWDFYKPVGWEDPFPLMRDGKHSIDVYMACLDGAQSVLEQRLAGANLLRDTDYFAFHCTSTYLCKRAFDRLASNAEPGLSLKDRLQLYKDKVHPGTLLTKQIGSTYTASCYVNLYSLLLNVEESLEAKTINVFSYGSGAAASMFRFHVDGEAAIDRTVPERLASRRRYEPEAFVKLAQSYSEAYGRFDFTPQPRGDELSGVYYLSQVDEWGRRFYRRSGSAGTSKI